NEVMSFGSGTPIEVAVSGPDFVASRAHAAKVYEELSKVPTLRDLRYVQALDYPTVEVQLDRERAGLSGVTTEDVARSLVAATSSSRFVVPNYWRDPKNGVGYQVQVEVPQARMDSVKEVAMVPVKQTPTGPLLLRDVAAVVESTMPGEYDRYNMRRVVSMTANIEGEDLGRVANRIDAAIKAVGVAVANAILRVTFAERHRRDDQIDAATAAVEGGRGRLRPILMTSCAMMAGMLPMALGLGEGGEQTAPLGRAVIGGLAVATLATLLLLPSVFAIVMGDSSTKSASLDPDDPDSAHHDTTPVGQAFQPDTHAG